MRPVELGCLSRSLSVDPMVARKLIESGCYRQERGRLVSAFLGELSGHPRSDDVFITPLIAGGIDDIRAGQHHVLHFPFEGLFTGLQDCVRIEKPGITPVYIVDNHNRIYFPAHEAVVLGGIRDGAIFITIDKHPDGSAPQVFSEITNLSEAREYERQHLNLANYIFPLLRDDIIGEYWYFQNSPGRVVSGRAKGELVWTADSIGGLDRIEITLAQLLKRHRGDKNIILNIDLDAFIGRILSSQDLELYTEEYLAKVAKAIARIAKNVGVVFIATSPRYANQKIAIRLARRIACEIFGEDYDMHEIGPATVSPLLTARPFSAGLSGRHVIAPHQTL
ncbi:hypothetical protein ACFL31_01090 [Candidatus Margulisiibacteriota bacterium]